MIIGIGIDIVDVERVEDLLRSFGDRLEEKLLSRHEREVVGSKARRAESLAARVAAKEAVIKAFGTDELIPFRSIEIAGSGPLGVRLSGRAKRAFDAAGAANIFVSISHEAELAIAVAVLEG